MKVKRLYFLIYQNMFSLGDKVVEWNDQSLQGATFEEFCDIILESCVFLR